MRLRLERRELERGFASLINISPLPLQGKGVRGMGSMALQEVYSPLDGILTFLKLIVRV